MITKHLTVALKNTLRAGEAAGKSGGPQGQATLPPREKGEITISGIWGPSPKKVGRLIETQVPIAAAL